MDNELLAKFSLDNRFKALPLTTLDNSSSSTTSFKIQRKSLSAKSAWRYIRHLDHVIPKEAWICGL